MKTTAKDIMVKEFKTLSPDAPISKAIKISLNYFVSHI